MNAYWLSWYHFPEDGDFEIHSPWWISGWIMVYENDEMIEVPTIVAAVKADSEDAAWDFIQNSYDYPPEDIERRFCEELTRESPFTDRFPKADWMVWD